MPYSVLTKKSKEPNQTETKILENFSLMLETEIKDLSKEFNKLSFTDKINELLNTLNSPNNVYDMCKFMETPVFNEYLTGIMTPDVITELINKYSETTPQGAQPSIDDIIKLTVANLRNGTMKKSLQEAKITHLSEQTFQKLKNANDDVSPFELNGPMINNLGGGNGLIIGIGKAVNKFIITPLFSVIYGLMHFAIYRVVKNSSTDIATLIDFPVNLVVTDKHKAYNSVISSFNALEKFTSDYIDEYKTLIPTEWYNQITNYHKPPIILRKNGGAYKKRKVTKRTNRKRNRGRTHRK